MLRKKIPSDTTGDRSRDLPTSSYAIPGPNIYGKTLTIKVGLG